MQETWVWSMDWEDPLEKGIFCPLQYSCLENSMDRGDWWAMVHGIAKSQTRLSDQHILYSRVWGKIPCHLLLLKMSCIGYSSLIALSGYDDEIWWDFKKYRHCYVLISESPRVCVTLTTVWRCLCDALVYSLLRKFSFELYCWVLIIEVWLGRGVNRESEVTQSCPTLCDPMVCSLPGSSLHGILQARVLEWIAISFSRGSSWPRDRTRVSRIPGRRFNLWATVHSCNMPRMLVMMKILHFLAESS